MINFKELLSNAVELIKFTLFFISIILIWSYIPWLAIILLIIISPVLFYETDKLFREVHQNNLDDIQEQLNIVQDQCIEDISNKVRKNLNFKNERKAVFWNYGWKSLNYRALVL